MICPTWKSLISLSNTLSHPLALSLSHTHTLVHTHLHTIALSLTPAQVDEQLRVLTADA